MKDAGAEPAPSTHTPPPPVSPPEAARIPPEALVSHQLGRAWLFPGDVQVTLNTAGLFL